MRRHVAQIALARYGLVVLAVAAPVAFALWLRPVAPSPTISRRRSIHWRSTASSFLVSSSLRS